MTFPSGVEKVILCIFIIILVIEVFEGFWRSEKDFLGLLTK
jgi:uncharacterized membrane protein YtjA (UPF0391 family)